MADFNPDRISIPKFTKIVQQYFQKKGYVMLFSEKESYENSLTIMQSNNQKGKVFAQISHGASQSVSLTSIVQKNHVTQFSKLINLAITTNRETITPIKYFYDTEKRLIGGEISFGLKFYQQQVQSNLMVLEASLLRLLDSLKEASTDDKNQLNTRSNKNFDPDLKTAKKDLQETKLCSNLDNYRKCIDKAIYSRKKSSKLFKAKKKSGCISGLCGIANSNYNLSTAQKNLEKLCTIKQSAKAIKITRTIQIQNFFQENEQEKVSNFSITKKTKAEYLITQSSIFDSTNKLLHNQETQKVKIKKNGYLVEKTPRYSINKASFFKQSFFTQSQIVQYLRSYQCEVIAQLFLEELIGQQIVQKIYSTYYPFLLFDKDASPKRKLFIMFMICFGLAKMETFKIIHRDIKPDNILLDDKIVPKIIDFGSAASSLPKGPRLNISQNLRTTRGYNILYSDVPESVRTIVSLNEFQRHQNFDIYAFGIILGKTIENKQFKNFFQGFLYENMIWVSQKCVQKNPYDRISPAYLYGFLKYIWILAAKNAKIC